MQPIFNWSDNACMLVTAAGLPYAADPALHMLRRASFGFSPQQLAGVRASGAPAWLAGQLNFAAIDDHVVTAALARWKSVGMSAAQVEAAYPLGAWEPMNQLQQATLMRAACSRRQLFEVMVELWSNHFNITVPSDKVWSTIGTHDRTVIRPHAMGRFADLLQAVAKSPAMLRYLDNAISRGTDPNENYGRELLELHTVGLQAHYTEADVRNSTYALTGWSVDDRTSLFQYKPAWRYTGPIKVLGWSSSNSTAAGGLAVGQSYLDYLAHHPMTARTIARKLAVRFVSDSPSEALIASLAAVYLAHDTAIVPVLQALFRHPEFLSAAGRKTRRPIEDVTACLRLLNVKPSSDTKTDAWGSLVWALGRAGHEPLGWGLPDGYPDVASRWMSADVALARWNLHQAITGRWWIDGMVCDPVAKLLPAKPATADQMVDRLAHAVLQQGLSPSHQAAVVRFLGLTGSQAVPDWVYTYRLEPVVTLLLNSTYWVMR